MGGRRTRRAVRARPLGAGDQGGHALPRKFCILGSWRLQYLPQIYRIAPNFGGAKFSRIFADGVIVTYLIIRKFSRSKFSRLEVDPLKTRKFILAPRKFGAILSYICLCSIIIDLARARRPYKCTRNYHSITSGCC